MRLTGCVSQVCEARAQARRARLLRRHGGRGGRQAGARRRGAASGSRRSISPAALCSGQGRRCSAAAVKAASAVRDHRAGLRQTPWDSPHGASQGLCPSATRPSPGPCCRSEHERRLASRRRRLLVASRGAVSRLRPRGCRARGRPRLQGRAAAAAAAARRPRRRRRRRSNARGLQQPPERRPVRASPHRAFIPCNRC